MIYFQFELTVNKIGSRMTVTHTVTGLLENIMVEWCTASSTSAKISMSNYLSTQSMEKLEKYLLILV